MKILFISIDVESDFAKKPDFLGVENLDKILNIFKEYGAPATLFITGNVLERYTKKIKEWGESFEIACHSFSHAFWNNLDKTDREQEIARFSALYQRAFGKKPTGFRAPSHLIDEGGLKLLQDKGFLYDSSIVPHYPPFKQYRGYRGKAPLKPYFPNIKNYQRKGEMKILEIPVSGLILGTPLAGTWISRLPFFIYQGLLAISNPDFLTLNLHSWNSLDAKLLLKIDRILGILKTKGYQFLPGSKIYELFSRNRK